MFAEFLNRDMCLKSENDESTIASVAMLDVWIYVTAVFICDDRSADQRDKQRGIQKKYQEVLSKHLPLSVQQVLQSLCTVLLRVNDAELFSSVGVASKDAEKFINSLRECTKVVYKTSTIKYYVDVTATWIQKYASHRIESVFD